MDSPPQPDANGGSLRPGGNFHSRSLGHLVAWPAVVFFVTSASFVFLYHYAMELVFLIVGVCVAVSGGLMAVPNKRANAPAFWFNVGILCLTAAIMGSAAGMWNFNRNTGLYWAYQGQREYTNVRPESPALSVLDAGKLQFSSDAKVDLSKAAGYKAGSMYCAAPVIGREQPSPIEFWAAGVGCCDATGGFTCGKVKDDDARSGLVYLQELSLDTPDLSNLRNAAKAVQDQHGLASSSDALFVHWVDDPDRAAWEYHLSGVGFWIGTSLIYVGCSVGAGMLTHFGSRAVPAKSQ